MIGEQPRYPFILLPKEAAASALGISVSTLEKQVREKRLPQPREISPGRVGWLVEELQEAARKLPVSNGLPPKGSGYGRTGKPRPEGASESSL
ncbi:AlpA family phage regulatory protein [Corticibacter populi]|uniref:AlpA family phage regulatory protein n=1 Tax=Corticibacter populi TaxID=1550736 RepID=A0A3M6QV27_9BURK|nr:AlpA family phage regulatory protein [Corticibacter populi]RMX06741.1 AlpA family phage regulatory protein [Corticibacter populi]RZS31676.1 AlpA family transcriptional regulator [Corticibacter populi]